MGVRSIFVQLSQMESHRATTRFAGMAAVAAAAQLVSVEPWISPRGGHALWLPGAALMCTLLWRPYVEWAACFGGALLGCVGILALRGATATEATALILGLLLLVTAATLLIRQFGLLDTVNVDFPQVATFWVIAVLALPLSSTGWTLLVLRSTPLPDFAGAWHNLLLANALPYLLIVPTFIALVRMHRRTRNHRSLSRLHAFLALMLLLLLWTAWMLPWASPMAEPLLMLASTLLLAWLLLVLGPAGAFLALSCSTVLCMAISIHGWGPLASGDGERTTLAVQLWAFGDGITLLLLSVLVEQRQSARNSLQAASTRLADMTAQMLRVQEEERTRIARDLHDDINQSLAAISIQLSSLKRAAPALAREQMEQLQEQVLEVSSDVRRLSHDLHPSLLRYTSLSSALRSLCSGSCRHASNRVHCDINDEQILDEQQKLNLFRITQEAIHNVNQHAHARNAWVRLQFAGGQGLLEIEDDGIGIDQAHVDMHRGLGMISIEERARLLGGSSHLQAAGDSGTLLSIVFPVRRPARADSSTSEST
ncbi:histidine kinase [Stenotrophomonas terrae]|nr:histidine kinase [Stenotrophomonas terrae]